MATSEIMLNTYTQGPAQGPDLGYHEDDPRVIATHALVRRERPEMYGDLFAPAATPHQLSTPTSSDLHSPLEYDLTTPYPKEVRSLAEAYQQAFAKQHTDFFEYGRDYKPEINGNRRDIMDALQQGIYSAAHDIFDTNGHIRKEKEEEWNNIAQIAPQILEIFTAPENHISSVNLRHIGNLARFAVDVARHPELLGETALFIGFGGAGSSTEEYENQTPARIASYALPGLAILQKLHMFYMQREANAIRDEQIRQAVDREAAVQQQHHPVDGAARAQIKQQIIVGGRELPHLTPDTVTEIKKRFSIPDRLPQLRLFFAYHVALAINHRAMGENNIVNRAISDKNALQTLLSHKVFDAIRHLVVFPEDIYPQDANDLGFWERRYASYLIETSADPTIQSVLRSLTQTGERKGGTLETKDAADYAADHVFLFGRRVNLPSVPTLVDDHGVPLPKPQVTIDIGGDSEKRFMLIEDYLSRTMNSEGFLWFLTQSKRENPLLGSILDRNIAFVENWMKQTATQRQGERTRKGWHVADDLPDNAIALGTSRGKGQAAYYFHPHLDFRFPESSDTLQHAIAQHLHDWEARIAALPRDVVVKMRELGIEMGLRGDYEALQGALQPVANDS